MTANAFLQKPSSHYPSSLYTCTLTDGCRRPMYSHAPTHWHSVRTPHHTHALTHSKAKQTYSGMLGGVGSLVLTRVCETGSGSGSSQSCVGLWSDSRGGWKHSDVYVCVCIRNVETPMGSGEEHGSCFPLGFIQTFTFAKNNKKKNK